MAGLVLVLHLRVTEGGGTVGAPVDDAAQMCIRDRDKAPPFVKVTKGGAFLREQIDKVMFIILL